VMQEMSDVIFSFLSHMSVTRVTVWCYCFRNAFFVVISSCYVAVFQCSSSLCA